jgi:hypothetical protein
LQGKDFRHLLLIIYFGNDDEVFEIIKKDEEKTIGGEIHM